MTNKKIIAAVIVLLFLTGYYFIFEVKNKNENTAAKNKAELLLPDLITAQVVQIEIIKSEGRIILEKKSEAWMLKTPVLSKADYAACENLISEFAKAKVQSKINVENLAEFGLDNPKIKVKLELSSGKSFILAFGAANLTDEYVYTLLNDKSSVIYLAPISLQNDATKDISAWKYKETVKEEIKK